jgi:hypothetical protein
MFPGHNSKTGIWLPASAVVFSSPPRLLSNEATGAWGRPLSNIKRWGKEHMTLHPDPPHTFSREGIHFEMYTASSTAPAVIKITAMNKLIWDLNNN